ncbi:unnamed protein product [Symbiodinium sp. KB8]|nr:unnamed protein product [Symbiodinium sp. KB8]
MRLNGDMLELKLSDSEVADLQTVRDLKVRLAAADPSSPCARLVRLVGPNGDLRDDEPLPMADIAKGCELQYILTSWMSLPEIKGALGGQVIPEGVWPNADERHQPWTLLAESVAKLEIQVVGRTWDFDGSLVLRDAWADALLSRPIARVFAETPSLLIDMFAFGRHLEESRLQGVLCWIDRFREVAQHVVALVEPETVQRCFATPDPETQKLLWESVRKKKPQRGARKLGGWGAADCFSELLKKGLPRWCWAGSIPPFHDSLLQYILEPTFRQHSQHFEDKDEAQGRLCIAVAERLTLEELCYQNSDGRSALHYAIECVPSYYAVQCVPSFAKHPSMQIWKKDHYDDDDNYCHFQDVIFSFNEHLSSLKGDGCLLSLTPDGDAPTDFAGTWRRSRGQDACWAGWHGWTDERQEEGNHDDNDPSQTVPDGGQTAGSGITIDHLSPPIPNLDDLGGKEDAVVCGSRKYGNRMSKKAMAILQESSSESSSSSVAERRRPGRRVVLAWSAPGASLEDTSRSFQSLGAPTPRRSLVRRARVRGTLRLTTSAFPSAATAAPTTAAANEEQVRLQLLSEMKLEAAQRARAYEESLEAERASYEAELARKAREAEDYQGGTRKSLASAVAMAKLTRPHTTATGQLSRQKTEPGTGFRVKRLHVVQVGGAQI